MILSLKWNLQFLLLLQLISGNLLTSKMFKLLTSAVLVMAVTCQRGKNSYVTCTTRKPVGFMHSWNRTSHFKSHLLLIWNFQMRLEMRCAIWNFLKLLKLFNPSQGLLIWNFQMRLEMRYVIWDFWDLKLCSWNFSNLKLCGSLNYLKLLKCPLRTKKFQITLNIEVINLFVHRVDIYWQSLTWILSALMFFFFAMINIVEHCQH